MSTLEDGRPRLVGRVGSLDAFWPLMEPLLEGLRPRRLCEIGVDQGIFTRRLLAWCEGNDAEYVGIDPAPDLTIAELVRSPGRLVLGRSLEVLPGVEPCEAYFIDGDHNFHTVRGELEIISSTSTTTGPLIFAHDVSWPWARRDMYHDPESVPADARQPLSTDLGVSLEADELVPGGLRSVGRYAIARASGGPRNGVLTAVESFLRDHAAGGWRALVVPMAYGLAILYRPDALPEPCRAKLEELAVAGGILGSFLESCEANYLTLYLYAEATKTQLTYWNGDGQAGRGAYDALQAAYGQLRSAYDELSDARQQLEQAYQALSKHSESLLSEYNSLLEHCHALERSVQER